MPKNAVAQQALQLRKAGVAYAKIAEQLGVSEAETYDLVTAALQAREEAPETRVRLDLERLDSMLLGLWKRIGQGDPKAVEQGLEVMRLRADMLAGRAAPGDGGEVGDYLESVKAAARENKQSAGTRLRAVES
ncbi:hypothetical protein NONI108955_01170 [Nocardia ninae]|uniref:Uncharacterized protein n=1 Tax=Nocardia ninae NBRC 108245 TaxID=1210091 RepID=A0A511MC40_9NOCA|nr:hypothetical protein [Nocardia ninae]GEM38190.1 hypothetical protein NN4_27090 [Nocardia ninae NBRC 108245]